MNFGSALASALGGALNNQVAHMNEMDKQEGLLQRLLMQEQGRNTRAAENNELRRELAEMRASGGASGSRSSGGGAGASANTSYTPEEMAALERISGGMTNERMNFIRGVQDGSAFNGGMPDPGGREMSVPATEDFKTNMIRQAQRFAQDAVTASARSRSNYKDMGAGDVDQANLSLARTAGSTPGFDMERAGLLSGIINGRPEIPEAKKDLSYQKASDITRQEQILYDELDSLRKLRAEARSEEDIKDINAQIKKTTRRIESLRGGTMIAGEGASKVTDPRPKQLP